MHVFQRELSTFKDTFQKGSQIYRFLQEKWSTSPLYLDRTLSFISRTRNRPSRKRETNIDRIAKRLESVGRLARANHNQNGVSDDRSESDSDASAYDPAVCYFNWICNNPAKTTQKTKSSGFICPWCEKNYHNVDSLMGHLKYSHPRFNFHLHKPTPDRPQPLIDMSLNLSYDGSYCGFKYPGHDLRHDFKFVIPDRPKHMTPTTQLIHFRPKRRAHGRFHDGRHFKVDHQFPLANDDEEADVDVCSGRLYYHTSTCLPIRPNEVDVDSEADIDPEWLRERTQLMIDEFSDVNEGEKEILKLWNLHIMKNYKYKGDGMMRQACLDFVDLEGNNLIAKNLSRNFILHLANLFDFGLISSRDVLECSRKLRKLKQPQTSCPPKTSSKIKLERNSDRSPHSTPAKRACLLNSSCNQ